MRRWKQGDRCAQRALLHAHYEAILAFARKKGWREPEDIAQQTVVLALRSIHRFRGESSLRTFLLAIARNVAMSVDRQYAREVPGGSPGEDAVDPQPSAAVDEQSALADALRSLPAPMQQTLYLSYWDELTQHQIAEQLAVPPGTVASRLRLARSHLRRRFDEGA